MNSNPKAQAAALELARRDVVFFVREFVWTYDPREPVPFMPLEPFACQEEMLLWLWDLEHRGKSGIVDKSRDMGATWICAAYAVHRWLFRNGAAIGFGSRKLELVDKLGDPKSIFDKIRTIIANLPSWMLRKQAAGYDRKLHDNFCKIINPANGATITGEGGDEIGRGGRTLIYFVDESAIIPRPQLIDASLTANCRTRIDVSTPRGSNNTFAVKRHSGKYPVMTLHWKRDPRKTAWMLVPVGYRAWMDEEQEFHVHDEDVLDYGLGEAPEPGEGQQIIFPWYEAKVLLEDPVTVAQEYDIDYTASLEGVAIPAKYLRACVGLKLPASAMRTAGYDPAGSEAGAENGYVDRNGPVVGLIKRWREPDPTEGAFQALRIAEDRAAHRFLYDSIGLGSFIGGAFKKVQRTLCFTWAPVNVGKPPTKTLWPDRQTSEEKFANLKAELWWRMRVRAEKTWRFVTQGTYFPPDELLSLPPGPETEALIAQLSNVRFFETETGKIIIESKRQLEERGVKSPDLAEALLLSFAPFKLTGGTGKAGGSPPVKPPGGPTATLPKTPHTLVNAPGKKRTGRGRSA